MKCNVRVHLPGERPFLTDKAAQSFRSSDTSAWPHFALRHGFPMGWHWFCVSVYCTIARPGFPPRWCVVDSWAGYDVLCLSRSPAESVCKGNARQQGYSIMLLKIIGHEGVDIASRQVAGTMFKNFVRENWDCVSGQVSY